MNPTPTPRLFVATPMYGGMCSGAYMQSMLGLSDLLRAHRIEMLFGSLFNESLVTRARNALAQSFLATGCSHLLFVDADIRFRPPDVLSMLAAGVDVLCGIYPKKLIDWEGVRAAALRGEPDLQRFTGTFVMQLAGDAEQVTVPVDRPAEIRHGGTGFMLIARRVFERMAPHVPRYADDSPGAPAGATVSEYFATSIEPGTQRLLSEDYHFCRRWRELGGTVHAAPWVKLAHIGTYTFEGELTAAP
jgi:hypothetical protein